MNDLKKYTPTHFLSQLIRTYEGNIHESSGVKIVDDYLQNNRYVKDPYEQYTPIICPPGIQTSSVVNQKHEFVNNIDNSFLERHPSWKYRYTYYELSQFRDTLCYAFFHTFDPMFLYIPLDQQYDWIRDYKFTILTDFLKNGYYQKYSYSATTDFKKSDLDDVFGMDKTVSIQMIRIICDVFGINLIWFSHDGIMRCPSICDSDTRVVWILVEDFEKGWYVLRPEDKAFYTYRDVKTYLRTSVPKDITDKYNLDDIQRWAHLYGIDHKKDGKTGKRNKLKEELIEEIAMSCKNPEK